MNIKDVLNTIKSYLNSEIAVEENSCSCYNLFAILYISELKTMSETTEKWSNLEETAEYLGVTKDTIRNWIKKTDIPAHKIGRLWEFKFPEVDE